MQELSEILECYKPDDEVIIEGTPVPPYPIVLRFVSGVTTWEDKAAGVRGPVLRMGGPVNE